MIGDAPKPEEKAVPPAVETKTEAPAATTPDGDNPYRRVKIAHGVRGWGGPLIIEPKPGKNLIYCVTGGGIHPVAQRIADLTGGQTFDGFRSKADFEQIAVAVIDCGGTARVGVYPMKGVPTVDIHATSPSGPLMKYIKETNFVSGVTVDNITLLDE
ncbi:MAG: PTS sorbitol transporter [Anaerolineae bacterium]|nr:PTS sorbitol transporter [Anaerolineales bacterium]MCQ3974329.1 PTS sorbitol transporter [Anaerolineae bacterium]